MRAIRLGEEEVCPRISDLSYILASTCGKIELESVEEGEEKVVNRLIQGAVTNVFNRYFTVRDFDDLLAIFQGGMTAEVSELTPSLTYLQKAKELGGLSGALDKLEAGEHPSAIASAMEFILEGLHLNKKLNKDRLAGRAVYRG